MFRCIATTNLNMSKTLDNRQCIYKLNYPVFFSYGQPNSSFVSRHCHASKKQSLHFNIDSMHHNIYNHTEFPHPHQTKCKTICPAMFWFKDQILFRLYVRYSKQSHFNTNHSTEALNLSNVTKPSTSALIQFITTNTSIPNLTHPLQYKGKSYCPAWFLLEHQILFS